eukprot:scaffold1602_cov129-Skeletonema_marinoi.AAC.2
MYFFADVRCLNSFHHRNYSTLLLDSRQYDKQQDRFGGSFKKMNLCNTASSVDVDSISYH